MTLMLLVPNSFIKKRCSTIFQRLRPTRKLSIVNKNTKTRHTTAACADEMWTISHSMLDRFNGKCLRNFLRVSWEPHDEQVTFSTHWQLQVTFSTHWQLRITKRGSVGISAIIKNTHLMCYKMQNFEKHFSRFSRKFFDRINF